MIPVNVTYYDFECSLISVPEGRSFGVISSDSLVVHHYWPNGTVHPSKMEYMQFPLGGGRYGRGLENVTEIILNKTSENQQFFSQSFSDSLKIFFWLSVSSQPSFILFTRASLTSASTFFPFLLNFSCNLLASLS